MQTVPTVTPSEHPVENGHEPIAGAFEPPTSPTLSALARHKRLILLGAVLFAVAGAAYGTSRPTVYTTSATLQVGQVNPNSPGFYGYAQSAASLATAFSRGIEAQSVLQAVNRKLGLTPTQAARRLSAAPIPVSPAFRVIATGPSERAALQLANVAAGALVNYESQSNSTNPEAQSLLGEYQHASLALRRAQASLAHLSRAHHGYSSPLAAAEAQQSAARERLQALGVAYTNAIASRAPSRGLVSLVADAATASDDRKAKVEMFGFIGLLLGAVLGCVAAILLDLRVAPLEQSTSLGRRAP